MPDLRCADCGFHILIEGGRLSGHSLPIGGSCPGSGKPADALRGLIAEVQFLHDADAKHKRGFRLSERTEIDALLHTIEELTEVGRAQTTEEATSELGDALGCLIHFAIKRGVCLDAAAWSALRKLTLDFPGSNEDARA